MFLWKIYIFNFSRKHLMLLISNKKSQYFTFKISLTKRTKEFKRILYQNNLTLKKPFFQKIASLFSQNKQKETEWKFQMKQRLENLNYSMKVQLHIERL